MKNLAFIVSLMCLSGCSTKKANEHQIASPAQQTDAIGHSPEITSSEQAAENTYDSRIDLDYLIRNEQNDYLGGLADSVLSLCCYDVLDVTQSIDYSAFQKTEEKYSLAEAEIEIVDVYHHQRSFIKRYYNKNPRVLQEELVCGRICQEHLLKDSMVHIGMPKAELLKIAFRPSEVFSKIKRLNIYQIENSEAHTSYRFEEGMLSEILFDSDYTWIDKELKR